MKTLLSFFFACLIYSIGFAQSVEGRVDYLKSKYRAAVLEVPYPPEQVEDAFDQYMKKKGSPGTSVKGMRLYRNVKMDALKNFYGDMYVNIEKKSRREKEATTISVVVGRPNETISSRSPDDDYGLAESKQFLNKMVDEISAHSIGVAIAAQEELLKKSERKYNDLIMDSTDLIKKQTELNEKMAKNAEFLKSQRAALSKDKEALQELMSRKKSN
jgi:hypothetical protein